MSSSVFKTDFRTRWMVAPLVACAVFSVYGASEDSESSMPDKTDESVPAAVSSGSQQQGQERAPILLKPAAVEEAREVPEQSGELEEAILMVQEQDYESAIPILEASLKRDPTMESVWEALGWSYYHTGKEKEAGQLWKQYFELRPDSPKAYSLLSQLALLKKDWNEADRYLRGSLKLDPDNYDIRYWYAQNLFRLGRLEKADKILTKLAEEDPLRINVRIDLARIRGLVQDYDGAVMLWEEILELIPDNLDFVLSYSRALLRVGSIEEAQAQARRVLAADPSRWGAMQQLADIAAISQRPEQVVKTFEGLIDEAEDRKVRAKLQVRLAVYYLNLWSKDRENWSPELPLDLMEQAVDERPDYVPWLNQYAELAIVLKKPRRAEKMINRILNDFNPNNQRALRSRFELAVLLRRFALAERYLNDIFDHFNPEDPFRHLFLARLRAQEGRYREAMDELDRLEEAGNRGAVFGLLYHGLTWSEWVALTSTRRLEEHVVELQKAGFTFIEAADVGRYLKENKGGGFTQAPRPWLAKQIDKVYYAFSGKRRAPRHDTEMKVHKVAFVSFDDGLRSSFQLGTPVAQDLGVPFTMFVITSIDELNAPIYAAWDEIKHYHDTGAWAIGSHLMYANTDKPISSDTNALAFNLPNRIWNPERNRLESLRDWSQRVRYDFEQSRKKIEDHLQLDPDAPMPVAYPYGEIGQEEGSNLANILDPMKAILNEARRTYQAGFLVDQNGYTCFGESPFMVSRYEPRWDEDAREVVSHALVNHPVLAARHMRAELAALIGKPYLARKQLKLLRRDGYPEDVLRELEDNINSTVSAVAIRQAGDQTEILNRSSRYKFKPADLYAFAAFRDNRANEELSLSYAEVSAGLRLNPYVGVAVLARQGDIQQTLTSNIWSTVRQTTSSSSTETRTQTVNGQTTTQTTEVQTSQTTEVQTNRIQKYNFAADMEYVGGSLSLQVNDRSSIMLALGEKTVEFTESPASASRESAESELVGSFSVAWQPDFAVEMMLSFNHDVIPSAQQMLIYDSLGLNALWDVSDSWELMGRASYARYEDENSMMRLEGRSLWEIVEPLGIWVGLEALTYTVDEDSDIYWSPYWDTRIAAILRWRRSNAPHYSLTVDVRVGRQREKARPEDEADYLNLKAQAAVDGNWDPEPGPESGWSRFLGVSGTYRHRIWRHVEVFANVRTVSLRDYSEHDVNAGVQVNF